MPAFAPRLLWSAPPAAPPAASAARTAARDAAGAAGDAAGAGTAWDRRARIGRVLGALDDAADQAFGRLRGHRGVDTAALVTSNLADYGFVWAVVAAAKARRPGPARRRALRALAFSGVASAAVNSAVKQAVRRQRPAGAAGRPEGAVLPVRRPASSSFPSGHTLAAFCTAVVLPESPCGVAAAVAFAVAVAASRVHLRAHHASDVVGGAVIGTGVGLALRAGLPGTDRATGPGRGAGRRPVPSPGRE